MQLCLVPPGESALATALTAAGFNVRPSSSVAADAVLPAKGGSLAFVLCRTPDSTMPSALSSKLTAAAKGSRRCTALWLSPDAVNATDTTMLDAW